MNKYDDIVNLTRPISNHPKMPIQNRAKEFMPFAALTGYQESINEEGRIVSYKKILSIDKVDEINSKLKNIEINKKYHVIYYKEDNYKDGGNYIEEAVIIKKIDLYNKWIVTKENMKINIDDIYEITDKIY